ncbi:3'-5' exonuclease [Candidatus Pacearchaeota archaeon]|nr:3'-5' exonuclease [Candidatus Pacearchaeota archaeon]
MKILVIDIETTGFKVERDLIVEVGVVLLDLETGETEPIFHQLVKEDPFCFKHSEAWVFKNSDLRYEDVLNAKTLDIIQLQGLLALHPVVAWNSKFDFSFLEDRGLILSDLPCPMKKSVDFFRLPGKFGGYKWPKVQEAWDQLFPDSDYIEKHRGLDDALHEAKIIHALYLKNVWNIDDYIPK